MESLKDYFARVGDKEYQSNLFKPVCGSHVYKDVWDPLPGQQLHHKAQVKQPARQVRCGSPTSGLPWRDRSSMENEQAAFLGCLPRQVSHFSPALCIHWQDYHSALIVRVVSLVLHGEAVAQVRIPHVLVNVVATYDTKISTRLPSPRLCTCWSSSTLIVHLGATPLQAPFGPQCNFMVSIIRLPPASELFLGAPILEIIR